MKRDLIFLGLSLTVWGIGEGMFFNFQPLYLEQLGADPIRIGAILGFYGVATTLMHIPAGFLSDRYGRRKMMMAAWLLGCTAAWLMALANSLPIFIAGMLLYGTTLFVLPPLHSYVAAARGKLSVGRAITMISASFNLGGILGPWLGGWVAGRWGLRQTYYIAAILFLLSTLVLLLIQAQPVKVTTARRSIGRLAQNRGFLVYLGVVVFAMYVMVLPQALSPNFLQRSHGLSVETIGGLYALSGVGVVALNILLGMLRPRWGFILGQASVGAFALFLLVGAGLPWFMVGFFLLGGYRAARSLAAAQVRELVDETEMGAAFGVLETVGASATILAPPLAGFLFDRNPAWMYAISVVLTAAAILVSAGLTPRSSSDLAAVPATHSADRPDG